LGYAPGVSSVNFALQISALVSLVACAATAQSGSELVRRLGYPPDSRVLIVHADDLGMSQSVNRATFEAFERGFITSASVMVPCPWFPEVARFARAHPQFDYGIHLVLNSEWTPYRWGPVSPRAAVPTLLDAEGYFPLLEDMVVQQANPAEVERELRAQIQKAQAAGIPLTHLDTHMGTLLRSAQLFQVYLRIGAEFGLPVALVRPEAEPLPAGIVVPPGILLLDGSIQITPGVPRENWAKTYYNMLAALPPGVYELVVHLAYDNDEMRAMTFDHLDWGAAWRQADLDLVRSPEFRRFLQEPRFVRTTWKEIWARWRRTSTTSPPR
jgi:predicted glycoside hydrolase/deacetylase ChbG (UPF0249 family)